MCDWAAINCATVQSPLSFDFAHTSLDFQSLSVFAVYFWLWIKKLLGDFMFATKFDYFHYGICLQTTLCEPEQLEGYGLVSNSHEACQRQCTDWFCPVLRMWFEVVAAAIFYVIRHRFQRWIIMNLAVMALKRKVLIALKRKVYLIMWGD